jgi:hypothetical protein
MTAPVREPAIAPDSVRPMGAFPETAEGAALALLYLILDQDRSLTSRSGNQPVAAYLLDLYAECLSAASGDRGRGAPVRDMLQ